MYCSFMENIVKIQKMQFLENIYTVTFFQKFFKSLKLDYQNWSELLYNETMLFRHVEQVLSACRFLNH